MKFFLNLFAGGFVMFGGIVMLYQAATHDVHGSMWLWAVVSIIIIGVALHFFAEAHHE